MPTLRHEDIRDELIAGLSDAGRRQYEGFAAIYEARQIASGLAELRTTAHLSQREMAKRAGVDQADLSRIESGQITPSLPTLLRLLDAVGGTLVLARDTDPQQHGIKATKQAPASAPLGAGPADSKKRGRTTRSASGAAPVRPVTTSATMTAAGERV